MKLVTLANRWRQIADELSFYDPESAVVTTLTGCAKVLQEALLADLGPFVPIEVASRLTGLSQSQLRRRVSNSKFVRKSNGRWQFRTDALWQLAEENGGRGTPEKRG